MSDCLVCDRIEQIKNGKNQYFVRELKTGYVVLGDALYDEKYNPTVEELEELKVKLNKELDKLL